jgi:CheY-like chemotaxis protein
MAKWDDLGDVNLLVADDSVDTLDMLKTYAVKVLRWTGDFVTQADDIIEAVNKNCEEGQRCYDAIIADINYFGQGDGPRITGITAATQIRKIRPNVPILFFSAYLNNMLREEARRVNAETMAKPKGPIEVFDKVGQMIWDYRKKKAEVPEELLVPKYSNGISVPETIGTIISEANAAKDE